jgi:DNA-binding transcriptional regulator YiaG
MSTTQLARVRTAVRTGAARRVRLAAQITQPEIAADVQVSAAAISRWEAGERAPRGAAALRYLRVLERLSAATGVPLDGGAR